MMTYYPIKTRLNGTRCCKILIHYSKTMGSAHPAQQKLELVIFPHTLAGHTTTEKQRQSTLLTSPSWRESWRLPANKKTNSTRFHCQQATMGIGHSPSAPCSLWDTMNGLL